VHVDLILLSSTSFEAKKSAQLDCIVYTDGKYTSQIIWYKDDLQINLTQLNAYTVRIENNEGMLQYEMLYFRKLFPLIHNGRYHCVQYINKTKQSIRSATKNITILGLF
jgi:hypothetical protein